jgi:hypothetical protein
MSLIACCELVDWFGEPSYSPAARFVDPDEVRDLRPEIVADQRREQLSERPGSRSRGERTVGEAEQRSIGPGIGGRS